MAQFALQVSRWADKAQDRMDIVVRKVSLELVTKVVLKTPVETGRARGGWTTDVGREPSPAGGRKDKSGRSAIREAQRLIDRMIAGETIYIVNHVNYIVYLEDGSSDQAPAGMVKTTLREYPGIVERGAREAKIQRP